MSDDLKQLLERAAPERVGSVDSHELVERAMRQRTAVRVVVAASVIAIVGVGAVVGGSLLAGPPVPVEVVEQPTETPTATEPDRQMSAVLEFDPGRATAAEVAEVLDLRVAALGLDASTWVDGTRVMVGIHDQASAELVASSLLQPSLISVRPLLEDPAATKPDGCQPHVAPVDEQATLCGTSAPSPWTASVEDLPGHVVGPGFWVTQPVGIEVIPDSAKPGPDASVSIHLSDQDAERFTELTSNAACERDRNAPGQIAIVLGPFVHATPGMAPSVTCGTGITQPVMVVETSSEAQAEALGQALSRPLPKSTTLVATRPGDPPSPTADRSPRPSPVDGELTRELNDHLLALIAQTVFAPQGGDHDFGNASQVVQTPSGQIVGVFLYPLDRANLGSVTFEERSTEQIGDISLRLGDRSDGQPAARFDCGRYQFQFFGQDRQAAYDVARAIAELESCPYAPDIE